MAGDYAGAVSSAQSARNLAYAAIVCGLILIPLIIVLRVVVFAASASSNDYN
jgi:t-SNARE complex subunit (syntaxin)